MEGIFQGGAGMNAGKLVTADAGDKIAAATAGADQVGNLLQHLVANVVTVAVVDLLEIVEIDKAHRKLPAIGLQLDDILLQFLGEGPAIAEPGEMVCQRQGALLG